MLRPTEESMKFTSLGRTGLKVSRLCLGTMNFGAKSDKEQSFAIMDRAVELGINFFDTANRYGEPLGQGLTESIIGEWLEKSQNRDRIVLATKAFGPMGPGANDEGLSAYHLRRACEASLTRLRTDHIDLYQMHHIDRGYPHFRSGKEYLNGDVANLRYPAHLKPGTPWEEIWQVMETLVAQGKISYAGSSNFAAWNIAQANERARARHFYGTVSEQSKYSLLVRDVELEVLPACREYGVGFICYSPLGAGVLAGSHRTAEGGRRAADRLDDKTRKQLEAFEGICKKLGEEPANVALAWLLHNDVVTAPIVGPRTVEQLEASVGALEIILEEEVLAALDEIFPGPGNQAPEAYAW